MRLNSNIFIMNMFFCVILEITQRSMCTIEAWILFEIVEIVVHGVLVAVWLALSTLHQSMPTVLEKGLCS